MASRFARTWKDWLGFSPDRSYAGMLPKALAEERFAFFGKMLSERRTTSSLAARGLLVDGLLGDAVGEIYAERYFPPEAKAEAQDMVANIIAAFRKRIEALSWMDPATKAEAEAKLSTLYVGIGYPESWRDYSKYEVKADDIFGNIWRGSQFDYQWDVERLGRRLTARNGRWSRRR